MLYFWLGFLYVCFLLWMFNALLLPWTRYIKITLLLSLNPSCSLLFEDPWHRVKFMLYFYVFLFLYVSYWWWGWGLRSSWPASSGEDSHNDIVSSRSKIFVDIIFSTIDCNWKQGATSSLSSWLPLFMSPWRSCSRLTYYHCTRSSPDFGSHHIARRTHFRWMQSWISIGGLEDCSHESQWEILKITTMNFNGWLEDDLEFSNGDYSFEF